MSDAAADTIVDAKGRKIVLRTLNVLDQVKLLRAIGPAQSQNEPYVSIVQAAASVASIDGVPQLMPGNESQIDAAIGRLDDAGFAALMVHIERQTRAINAAAEAAAAAAVSGPLAQSVS